MIVLRRWGVAVLGLFVASQVWAQEEGKGDEKAEEEAAKEHIKAYKDEVKKAKSEDDVVLAIEKLGEKQHALVREELAKLLKHKSAAVRKEAVRQIARHEKDEAAATLLLDHAGKERELEVAGIALEGLGDLQVKSVAKGLTRFFGHQELNIAAAAISASGEIGSKDSVQPLIGLLEELERIQEKDDGSSPPLPGPGPGGSVPSGSLKDKEIEKKDRLTPEVLGALQSITDQKFKRAQDWRDWWVRKMKNGQGFKEKDEKDED